MSRATVHFTDRWRAAIKEAARANHNSVMMEEACKQGKASVDDLAKARKWKEAADAVLRAVGREYRHRHDH